MNRTKRAIVVSAMIVVIVIFALVSNRNAPTANPIFATLNVPGETDRFSQYTILHQDDFLSENIALEVLCDELEFLPSGACANGVFDWLDETQVQFDVTVAEAGMYAIEMTYISQTDTHLPITLELRVNGEIPYHEASQITLRSLWAETSFDLATDRYGNDVSSEQALVEQAQTVVLRDAEYLYDALYVYLESGTNTISFDKTYGRIELQQIRLLSDISIPSYQSYRTSIGSSYQPLEYFERLEAEEATYKNSSSIVRGISRDPLVKPFSLTKLKLNVLGTGTYDKPGESVTWTPSITEAGWYNVVVKAKQETDFRTMYRTLYVNGTIPFEEARHLTFSFDDGWQNVELKSFDGEVYPIYLEPGDTITLEVDGTLFRSSIQQLNQIIQEISQLGLDITKLTKNNTDPGIDWDIPAYFPNVEADLTGWVEELTDVIETLKQLSGYEKGSQIIQDLEAAIDKLQQIEEDINELPRMLTVLSTGSSSALQLIANQIDAIKTQPMVVDALFVTSVDTNVPNPNEGRLASSWIQIQRFFLSFVDPTYEERADAEELEVWVNRSRQYADIIQQLADQEFTPETGIKVKVSIINNDGKLLLANSADQQPDVAMGVSSWIPNEYGMRGMLYDMTEAEGYLDILDYYHSEQLVPMIYNDKLYGLPETENFYVLFYRRDIVVDELGLDVPQTWDDVVNMMPVLNRYGMSFYVPLSNASAFKSFDTTTPFIFQFGGQIYDEDGFGTALDSEESIRALEFMTDLYTEYGTPVQITSFFNGFRYGTVPIGIGDFGMYLQLNNAASDIRGLWDIALVPGVPHEVYNAETDSMETIINRSMPGSQQASIIFDKSDMKDEAWEFLSWWMSTDTQVTYSETLINTLGSRYIWNSANIQAFSQLRINEEHKTVILEQWEHLKEVPKIPGSYIIEREISNVWNQVVYDDANLRSSISDAILKIDKEIHRKMVEFGYMNTTGEVLRDFLLPTSATVEGWYDNED